MPSIVTHCIFALDTYKKMDNPNLDKMSYYLFNQSHDFLFYNFHKEIRDIGHLAHNNKTQEFILNIIKYILEYNLESNKQVISYLYGCLSHYVLDYTTYPYIFYLSGIYDKNKKDTYKYKGKHADVEKNIDAMYYKMVFSKEYKYSNISKEIIKSQKFSDDLKKLIKYVYKKTYKFDNMDVYYENSINDAKLVFKVVCNDTFGIKKLFYPKYLKAYSNHIIKPKFEYLNTKHSTWVNPCKKELVSNESFDDLYSKAVKEYLKIIKELNKIIFKTKDISKAYEIIPDVSYLTGFNNEKMKYFKN